MKKFLALRLPHHFGKYMIVSLVSTSVDFSAYFMLGRLAKWPASTDALIGAALGGLVSWALNQFWVFQQSKWKKRRTAFRYLVGIGIGIFLNGLLTGFFCENIELPRMAGRVAAAISVWFAIYWFNRKVVFHV